MAGKSRLVGQGVSPDKSLQSQPGLQPPDAFFAEGAVAFRPLNTAQQSSAFRPGPFTRASETYRLRSFVS